MPTDVPDFIRAHGAAVRARFPRPLPAAQADAALDQWSDVIRRAHEDAGSTNPHTGEADVTVSANVSPFVNTQLDDLARAQGVSKRRLLGSLATAAVTPGMKAPVARQADALGLSFTQCVDIALRSFFEKSPMFGRKVTPHEYAAWSEHVRAVAEDLPSDITGVIPTVLAGTDVESFVDANRYVVNAMRPVPMPRQGEALQRPAVSQRGLVASLTPGDAVPSRKVTIPSDASLAKVYLAGALEWSEQAVDWSAPEFLADTVLGLATDYGIASESIAAAALEASVTTNVVAAPASWTDAVNVLTAIVAAMTAVRASLSLDGNLGLPADTLFIGPSRFDSLVSLTDAEKRPVFARIIEATGLVPVYSPALSADTLIVARSQFVEWFEDRKGFTMSGPQAAETFAVPGGTPIAGAPAQMGVNVAFSGYVATNVRAEATCGIPAS